MPIIRFDARNIGTTGVAVSTTPASPKRQIVIHMSVANVHATLNCTVDIYIKNGGNDTYLAKGFPLPIGETVVPSGIIGKVGLVNGDVLYVRSSVATSVDCSMTVDEDRNA